jgi:hypothetical protein
MQLIARSTFLVLSLSCILLCGCRSPHPRGTPSIEFTKLPPSGEGSPDRLDPIEGRVINPAPGERIVLFARSGIWWVQPTVDQPFTNIQSNATWKNLTHPGSAYAALLVKPSYLPPTTSNAAPAKGGDIVAVAIVEGAKLAPTPVKTIDFSGYQWALRQNASNRGGTRNIYAPANAWTDDKGFLHLRILKTKDEWTSGEVKLARSLGYGSYRFVVRDISHLEPAVVFSIFTWDEAGPTREVDIEVSRWGETTTKNAQFVIQPYYVPANVIRFNAPGGVLTYSFRWEPGRMQFKTIRGSGPETASNVIAQHTFTSGVPSPGNELVHMNLYVYDNKSNPLRNGSEVIIEKFEYLP